MKRWIKEYEMIMLHDNIANRKELLEKYLNVLRDKMFQSIANNEPIQEIDKKIISTKKQLN